MCRSRREFSNVYFLAKFRFDTAENELSGDVDLIRHVLPPGIPTGKVDRQVHAVQRRRQRRRGPPPGKETGNPPDLASSFSSFFICTFVKHSTKKRHSTPPHDAALSRILVLAREVTHISRHLAAHSPCIWRSLRCGCSAALQIRVEF